MVSPWRLELTPRAERDLERVDERIRRRIVDALERLTTDPPKGDIRKLGGTEDEYRLRVGDWRVRFRRDAASRTVVILMVRQRNGAYRD